MKDFSIESSFVVAVLIDLKDDKSVHAVFECQKYNTLKLKDNKVMLVSFLGCFDLWCVVMVCHLPHSQDNMQDADKGILGQLKRTEDMPSKHNRKWSAKYVAEWQILGVAFWHRRSKEEESRSRRQTVAMVSKNLKISQTANYSNSFICSKIGVLCVILIWAIISMDRETQPRLQYYATLLFLVADKTICFNRPDHHVQWAGSIGIGLTNHVSLLWIPTLNGQLKVSKMNS